MLKCIFFAIFPYKASYAKCLFIFFCTSLFSYDPDFFDYSGQTGQPTAVAIIAFNRPEYLKQLLESLLQNPESRTLPFFFFLDGGDQEAQAENIRLIDAANFAQKIIISREINYGCPKNHIDSKRFLFDWCHFQRIVVLEEDLLVSKNYLKTLLHLHDWANENYSNIGTVQLWSKCHLTPAQKKENLSKIQENALYWSMVTYCMGKNVWDAISPLLSTYEKFIDPLLGNSEYDRARSKPKFGPTFHAYQRWIQATVASHNHKAVRSTFSSPLWISKYSARNWAPRGEFSMNQDQITSLSIWLAGYTRIQTVVNRVAHIGKKGISNQNHKLDIYLDEFEEDDGCLTFIRVRG